LNSGAVEPLVALLKEPHSEEWDIALQSTMTLFNIVNIVNTGNELFLMKARIRIAKSGAIEASLFTLRRRGFKDLELASWILKLLSNLVIGDHTNQRKLLDYKALTLIVSFLKPTIGPMVDQPPVHIYAAGLLWKLCQDVHAQRLIVRAGAKQPLLQIVQDEGDELAKTRAMLLLNRLEDRQVKRDDDIHV